MTEPNNQRSVDKKRKAMIRSQHSSHGKDKKGTDHCPETAFMHENPFLAYEIVAVVRAYQS
jgi:hypothetical protein